MMNVILIIFTVSLGFGLCCFILDLSFDVSEKIFKIGAMSLAISVFTACLGMLVSLMEAF